MNDDDLIAAVAAGDHTALRELFDRHAPWIAGRLRRVLPAEVVEDVVQETFIAVWRNARSYAGTGAVGGWLWGIARRQSALWLRKHGDGRAEPLWEMSTSDDPATAAIQRADIEQALVELGPEGSDRRELVRLMLIEDRPVAEVAGLLGIPEGTVKSRAHKVRRLLRMALGGGQP